MKRIIWISLAVLGVLIVFVHLLPMLTDDPERRPGEGG